MASKQPFEKKVDILKVDEDKRQVWGIFSMSKMNGESLVDMEGEIIETEDLEKAAHDFMLKSRMAGHNHDEIGVGTVIESFILTDEKGKLLEKTLKDVGVENPVIRPNSDIWFGAFYIHSDKTWNMIKSGEFKSFSIGGEALRTEIVEK